VWGRGGRERERDVPLKVADRRGGCKGVRRGLLKGSGEREWKGLGVYRGTCELRPFLRPLKGGKDTAREGLASEDECSARREMEN
jgi:hypothetical protein